MNFENGLKKLRFEDLKSFKILSETKNFIRAAEILKKTQGTMSSQINKLEEVFEVRLINRSSRNFELTESGLLLLEFIDKTFKDFKDLSDKISEIQTNESLELSGTIQISSSTIPGEFIIPRIIADFKKRNPSVNFTMHLKNSAESISDLKHKQTDFAAIGNTIASKEQEDYQIIEVGNDELYFVVSSNHKLFLEKTSIYMSDLFQYPFILREEGSGTRKAFENSKYFNVNIQIGLILDSNQSILTALRNSNYVTVLSSHSLNAISNRKIEPSDLNNTKKINEKLNPDYKIIVPVDYKIIRRSFFLVRLKNSFDNKLSQIFWEFCKEYNTQILK